MIAYLWNRRERPPFLSENWFRVWMKRLASSPQLIGATCRIQRLRQAGATVGEGCFISPASVVGARNLTIGAHSFIGRVEIHAHAQVRIGSCVCLNDKVQLLTASHDVKDRSWKSFSSPIVIEDFAWIASGAIILPGVRIGKGAVVGAGSVVPRSVPDFAIASGNPARVRPNIRAADLSYAPSQFVALFAAWLGKPSEPHRAA